jgi:hypothetical protein
MTNLICVICESLLLTNEEEELELCDACLYEQSLDNNNNKEGIEVNVGDTIIPIDNILMGESRMTWKDLSLNIEHEEEEDE